MKNIMQDMHITANLVNMNLQARSDQEVLEKMSDMLIQQGIVKESYKEAVKKREAEYATGLQCEHIGVAIPHTDAIHVHKQAIAISILDKPVKFKQMGMPEMDVEVKIVFMLAIQQPHMQMDFLQALMMIFQGQGQLEQLLACDTSDAIVSVFRSFFTEAAL